ncbi:uncharacterized [Tachysurus ichikawai]
MRQRHAKLTLAFLHSYAAAFTLSSAIKRKLQLPVQTACSLFIKCSFMSHRIAVYFYLPDEQDILCALAARNVKRGAVYMRQENVYIINRVVKCTLTPTSM